jgi:hypothetical protein
MSLVPALCISFFERKDAESLAKWLNKEIQ